MIVTINTDAAVHKSLRVGAFSFWIKCDQGKIMHTGVLKRPVAQPERAEFQCILNALYALGKSKFTNVTRIIVNTDCLNVIHVVTGNKSAIQKYKLMSWGKYLLTEYESMLRSFGWTNKQIQFRHVPAHKSTDTAKAWVNDYLDKASKKALWDIIGTEKTNK